ncbi:MAG: exodeoxyribonuclease VII large subunit [Burkholderiaceae bacterium]|jgi:exodeoxyribonuclease VII large subunit|nr:exodeoxyribonuclease VII large subunit [Burkholderiaceae bacterium]
MASAILSSESLTVSALNRAVAGTLARGFPSVRVRGEIGNLTRAASGHWYFTLKDDAAQVRCVMFRSRNALVGFAPREGDEVELRASVGLYEARGEFQLTVDAMQRAGQGRLFEEFLRLKSRLAAEGLFDDALKRPLPALPQAIGIVTSLQAAALRDVATTLARRAPYARLVVYPVPVQGEGAGDRIAAMLSQASRRAEVDVLLLVRGGGSIEDLWAFNEEVVARAIRACALPVVVGVGHESDITIADFAADLRAPTPTAAAELAAPEHGALRETVAAALFRLQRYARLQLQSAQQRLDYASRVLARPRAPVAGLQSRVEQLHLRLRALARLRLGRSEARFGILQSRLARRRPDAAAGAAATAQLVARLRSASVAAVAARRHQLQQARQALSHLDPHAVLQRGYALALDAQGAVVSDAARLAPGQSLQLRLARGAADVRVTSVAPVDASAASDAADSSR